MSAQAIPLEEMPKPSSDFDRVCNDLLREKESLRMTQSSIADLERALIKHVEASKQASGQKSLRAAGELFEATVTYGQKVEVVEEVAVMLRDACHDMGKPGLFKKLIAADVRYRVQRAAQQAIDKLAEGDKLAEAARRVITLFGQARLITDKKPIVKVERKSAK